MGVLSVLHERGYRFERAAGTSAGAIVAALVAAGMSPPRMHEILGQLDYRAVRTWDWEEYLRRYRAPSAPDKSHVDAGELREAAAVEEVRRDLDDEALGGPPDRHPADDQDSLR